MGASYPPSGGGFVRLTTLVALPGHLRSDCPAAPHGQPAVAAAGAEDVASCLGAAQRLLDSFPGPLGPSVPKERIQKWLKERAERAAAEEGGRLGSERLEAVRSLWEALRLMARHGGHLRPVQGARARGARACGVGRGSAGAARGGRWDAKPRLIGCVRAAGAAACSASVVV